MKTDMKIEKGSKMTLFRKFSPMKNQVVAGCWILASSLAAAALVLTELILNVEFLFSSLYDYTPLDKAEKAVEMREAIAVVTPLIYLMILLTVFLSFSMILVGRRSLTRPIWFLSAILSILSLLIYAVLILNSTPPLITLQRVGLLTALITLGIVWNLRMVLAYMRR